MLRGTAFKKFAAHARRQSFSTPSPVDIPPVAGVDDDEKEGPSRTG